MAARLVLADMDVRHPGLTAAIAGGYLEAASVCLSRHHDSPVQVRLSDGDAADAILEVEWEVPDERTRGAWANAIDATAAGAYGCVLAGIEVARGWVAVRRAEQGTGADYYIGPPGAGRDDLEDCVRLEVSGSDRGDRRELERRMLQKVGQLKRGEGSLPAVAGVLGYEVLILLLRDVVDP